MAWNNPLETFIGASGQLYTADVGTAFPSGFATPSASWPGLGYASEDGVAFSYDRTIEEYRAWQSANPIRRAKTEESFQISAALLQWNEETVPAALGGGVITSVSGGYQYTPPGPEETLEERAVICDLQDGDRTIRILIPRGNAAEAVEASFSRGSMSELTFTFQALTPDEGDLFTILFDDSEAFAAGS